MTAPKPTLGYPSRTAAVAALLAAGKTVREIAEAIGISVSAAGALEHSAARRNGRRLSRPAEQFGRTVVFPKDILDRLSPHAAKRGIHVNHLARLIVETVVE